MSETQFTNSLKVAAGQAGWHGIAEILRLRLAAEPDRAGATSVFDVAAKATGLKPVVLKRLLAIVERLDRVTSETGIAANALLSGSYNAVELALRLYDRDREAGLRALADLRSRRTTIAKLQRLVAETPPGTANPAATARSAALVHRARTIKVCREAIAEYVHDEFGRRASMAPRPVLRHFHRAGFDIAGDGRILAGVDLHLPEPPQPKDPDGLAHSLLLARLLPLFVVAISIGPVIRKGQGLENSASVDAASEWAATTRAIDMGWVGILTIDADGAIGELQPPKPNPDDPDPAVYSAVRAFLAARG